MHNLKKVTSTKNLDINLMIITIFQIFLLLNMSSVDSYFVYESYNLSEKIDIGGNNFDLGLNLLMNFLTIKQIGLVSAEADYCCPEKVSGELCQNIESNDSSECAVNLIPGKCSEFLGCAIGCCVDRVRGLCTARATKDKCESGGGIWNTDETCVIAECRQGCCILGYQIFFNTQQRCNYLSSIFGVIKDFRPKVTLEECLFIESNQSRGACVSEEGCSIQVESQCDGNYYEGKLCSNPELNTSCERQESVGCLDEKDEIYWFDSCGNKENIYSSDKNFSWNDGKILAKNESCNPREGNINSQDCGNCNRFLSSVCSESTPTSAKIADGNFYCKDLTCVDEFGNPRYNGEKWCVYDNSIGRETNPWGGNTLSSDPVGSRHWVAFCHEGKVELDGCEDYRGQICSEKIIEEGDKKLSLASCVPNEATSCTSYNRNADSRNTNCNNNKHCAMETIYFGEIFRFELCVPKYPKGFDLNSDDGEETAIQTCALASTTCTVLYQKNKWGRYKCEKNCNCEKQEFYREMHDACISLGDCGSYINYLGKGTNNVIIQKTSGGLISSEVDWQNYEKYKNIVPGKLVEFQDVEHFQNLEGGANADPDGESTFNQPWVTHARPEAGLLVGDIGGFILYYLLDIEPGDENSGKYKFYQFVAGGNMPYNAKLIADWTRVSGKEATLALQAAGATGNLVWVVYILISGWGRTQDRQVKFTCRPWQPPVGGEDCHLCHEDPLKPCSQYRCTSLGAGCKLIDGDTSRPKCIWQNPDDVAYPLMSPLDNQLPSGYKFATWESCPAKCFNTLNSSSESQCLGGFQTVVWGVKTNEHARCKWDFVDGNYDDLRYDTSSTHKTEHLIVTNYPGVKVLEQELQNLISQFANVTSEDYGEGYEDLVNVLSTPVEKEIKVYVRCQDSNGYSNPQSLVVSMCLDPEPDLTAVNLSSIKGSIRPAKGSLIKYNATSQQVTMYVNEPANCKYSDEDKSYDSMENNFTCETSLTSNSINGWFCETNMTGLVKVNKKYIRCEDKPQFPKENRTRNGESFEYSLYQTTNKLVVSSIDPEGEQYTSFVPINLKLKVKTAYGANNSKASCTYSSESYDNATNPINSENRMTHETTLTSIGTGSHTFFIRCEDDIGNVAYGNSTVEVILDETYPIITRIYKEGNKLKIKTSEEATCYYSNAGCSFNLKGGKSMTSAGFQEEHSTSLVSGQTYYIKCADFLDNAKDDCLAIVKPDQFKSSVKFKTSKN